MSRCWQGMVHGQLQHKANDGSWATGSSSWAAGRYGLLASHWPPAAYTPLVLYEHLLVYGLLTAHWQLAASGC